MRIALGFLRFGESVDPAVERDVLEDSEVFVERELLAHVSDSAADRRSVCLTTSRPAT